MPNDSEDAIEKDLGEDPEAEAECDRIIGEMSDKEIVGRGFIGPFGQISTRPLSRLMFCIFFILSLTSHYKL